MQTEPTVSSAWFPGQDRSKFALFLRKVATLVHRNTSVTEANLKTGPKLKPIWSCRLDLPSKGWPTDMDGRESSTMSGVRVSKVTVQLALHSWCGWTQHVWHCFLCTAAAEDVVSCQSLDSRAMSGAARYIAQLWKMCFVRVVWTAITCIRLPV